MAVTHIHTFLVPPRAPEEGVNIGGALVPLEGKLFSLLNDIYTKSDVQCNIDIAFNHAADGAQHNAVRALLLNYVGDPQLERGRAVATRLSEVTTKRSGLGLLFLIRGVEDDEHKIVVSRFPADNGILAEMNEAQLNVEFLERVFMKSAHSYKAVAYRDASLDTGFWQGRAIDRQIIDPAVRVSDYWIRGFLESDFRTTPAAGTKRLALALKEASRTATDVVAKQAIAAAATLAGGLNGQQLSIADFQERFGLPAEARTAMTNSLRSPVALTERFVFSAEEFERQVAFRSVELDSGAILTAQTGDFERVFEREDLDGDGHRTRFSTIGTVVGDRLRTKAAS